MSIIQTAPFKAYELLLKNVSQVVRGKEDQIKLLLSAWFAGGHVLIEDNPGTGKTLLAKTLARSVNLEFGRVQFTPDLLPSDITGSNIYDEESKQFKFNRGPVFSSILLADEINRATPRTQSALLEAMGEFQVSADRSTYKLDEQFFVIATQNPIEQHGTFPLPEAQLDRFALKMGMGYPERDQELQILLGRISEDPLKKLTAVITREDIQLIRKTVASIKLSDATMKYILDVVEMTRQHAQIALPASPRASLSLMKVGQAYSFLSGDDFVRPGSIYKILPYVIEHRIAQTTESKFQGKKKADILSEILDKVRVPTK